MRSKSKWCLLFVITVGVCLGGLARAAAEPPPEEKSKVLFAGLFRTVDQVHISQDGKKLVVTTDYLGTSKFKGASLADVQATLDFAQSTGSLVLTNVPNLIAPDSYPIQVAMVRLNPKRLKMVRASVNPGGHFDFGDVLELREASTNALIMTVCEGCEAKRVDELISTFQTRLNKAIQRNVPVEINLAMDASRALRVEAENTPRPNAEHLADGELRDKYWSLAEDEYSYELYDPNKVSLTKVYLEGNSDDNGRAVPDGLNLFDMTDPELNRGIAFGGVQFSYTNQTLKNNAYYFISGQLQGIVNWCKGHKRLLEFNFEVGENGTQLVFTASPKDLK